MSSYQGEVRSVPRRPRSPRLERLGIGNAEIIKRLIFGNGNDDREAYNQGFQPREPVTAGRWKNFAESIYPSILVSQVKYYHVCTAQSLDAPGEAPPLPEGSNPKGWTTKTAATEGLSYWETTRGVHADGKVVWANPVLRVRDVTLDKGFLDIKTQAQEAKAEVERYKVELTKTKEAFAGELISIYAQTSLVINETRMFIPDDVRGMAQGLPEDMNAVRIGLGTFRQTPAGADLFTFIYWRLPNNTEQFKMFPPATTWTMPEQVEMTAEDPFRGEITVWYVPPRDGQKFLMAKTARPGESGTLESYDRMNGAVYHLATGTSSVMQQVTPASIVAGMASAVAENDENTV